MPSHNKDIPSYNKQIEERKSAYKHGNIVGGKRPPDVEERIESLMKLAEAKKPLDLPESEEET